MLMESRATGSDTIIYTIVSCGVQGVRLMKLLGARVCLDCEEIHAAAQCPSCASESFAFLTRWVPSQGRREQTRVAPQGKATSRSTQRILVGAGALAGTYFLSRWLKAAQKKIEEIANSKPTGER